MQHIEEETISATDEITKYLKDRSQMKYTIQETPTFTIFGVKREIKMDNAFELVPKFWRECRKKWNSG